MAIKIENWMRRQREPELKIKSYQKKSQRRRLRDLVKVIQFQILTPKLRPSAIYAV